MAWYDEHRVVVIEREHGTKGIGTKGIGTCLPGLAIGAGAALLFAPASSAGEESADAPGEG